MEPINPLKINSDLPQFPPQTRQNRSASAVFTPSQMQATYSFRTIQEEPSELPPDSPRFTATHSTPIFSAQQPSNMYIPDEIELGPEEDINTVTADHMTPELPSNATPPLPRFDGRVQSDNVWQQHQQHGGRSSLPAQERQNILKSRYSGHEQRSSLPPKENRMHMQASSAVAIAVPSFTFAKAPNGNKPVHFSSLQNIHEQQKSQNMIIPPSAPQLDQWVDNQQQQSHSPQIRPASGTYSTWFYG